jgi:hypothetical protein
MYKKRDLNSTSFMIWKIGCQLNYMLFFNREKWKKKYKCQEMSPKMVHIN